MLRKFNMEYEQFPFCWCSILHDCYYYYGKMSIVFKFCYRHHKLFAFVYMWNCMYRRKQHILNSFVTLKKSLHWQILWGSFYSPCYQIDESENLIQPKQIFEIIYAFCQDREWFWLKENVYLVKYWKKFLGPLLILTLISDFSQDHTSHQNCMKVKNALHKFRINLSRWIQSRMIWQILTCWSLER